MASHYEEVYQNSWQVAHNAIRSNSIAIPNGEPSRRNQVLLAGDINQFRFDAVLAFAEAIERHNLRNKRAIEFVVLGEVGRTTSRSTLASRCCDTRGAPAAFCLSGGHASCGFALSALGVFKILRTHFTLFDANEAA
jgi:hypothetical protein